MKKEKRKKKRVNRCINGYKIRENWYYFLKYIYVYINNRNEKEKKRVNRHINGYKIILNEKYGIKRMAIFIK